MGLISKKAHFLLGAPFCGSTHFSNLVNSIGTDEAIGLGEIDRLEQFNGLEHPGGVAICHLHPPSVDKVCNLHVWRDELSSPDLSQLYSRVLTRTNALVDSSKNPDSFGKFVAAEGPFEKSATLLVRNPYEWIPKHANLLNQALWLSASAFNDTYWDALRRASASGIPFRVVWTSQKRFFVNGRVAMNSDLLSFILDPMSGKKIDNAIVAPSCQLGGNANHQLGMTRAEAPVEPAVVKSIISDHPSLNPLLNILGFNSLQIHGSLSNEKF